MTCLTDTSKIDNVISKKDESLNLSCDVCSQVILNDYIASNMSIKDERTVLVIAATDPSGGAGTTADLKTIELFGVHATCAITAVTYQNASYFGGCEAVSAKILAGQLEAVLEAYGAQGIEAIKIGAIPNDESLGVILNFLQKYQKAREALHLETHIVLDPIGSATCESCSSAPASSKLTSVNFKEHLLELAEVVTLITPNLLEAITLCTSLTRATRDEMISNLNSVSSVFEYLDFLEDLASIFIKLGFRSVLLKGGHGRKHLFATGKECAYNIDFLTDGSKKYYLMDNKVLDKASTVHGTGCALASVICAMLAGASTRFDDLLSATVVAKAFVTKGIIKALALNKPKLNNCVREHLTAQDFGEYLPFAAANRDEVRWFLAKEKFASCPFKLGFYTVVDSADWIELLCKAGVRTLQLRIKDPEKLSNKPFMEQEIKRAIALGKHYGARVFIDDLWSLAASLGAYGVHLGQEDLDTAVLSQIRTKGLRLGVSTHSYGELARAMLLNPSYVALGHIFPTKSKDMPSAPQGLQKLALYVTALGSKMPTVAIGGIKLNNLAKVLSSNVGSVAVITAVTKALDPTKEAQKWLELVEPKTKS